MPAPAQRTNNKKERKGKKAPKLYPVFTDDSKPVFVYRGEPPLTHFDPNLINVLLPDELRDTHDIPWDDAVYSPHQTDHHREPFAAFCERNGLGEPVSPDALMLFQQGEAGWGVCARESIRAGTVLGVYPGVPCDPADQTSKKQYTAFLKKGMAMDAEKHRNYIAMSQHLPAESEPAMPCDDQPVATENVRFSGFWFRSGFGVTVAIAKRDIAPLEQVGFDYDARYWLKLKRVPFAFAPDGCRQLVSSVARISIINWLFFDGRFIDGALPEDSVDVLVEQLQHLPEEAVFDLVAVARHYLFAHSESLQARCTHSQSMVAEGSLLERLYTGRLLPFYNTDKTLTLAHAARNVLVAEATGTSGQPLYFPSKAHLHTDFKTLLTILLEEYSIFFTAVLDALYALRAARIDLFLRINQGELPIEACACIELDNGYRYYIDDTVRLQFPAVEAAYCALLNEAEGLDDEAAAYLQAEIQYFRFLIAHAEPAPVTVTVVEVGLFAVGGDAVATTSGVDDPAPADGHQHTH